MLGGPLDVQQRLLEIPADDDRLAAEVKMVDAALAEAEAQLARG
jgi:hypothetical protein